MISYNIRYRGPYEYDKFVLNILQLYNAIKLSELNELKNFEANNNSLIAIEKTINELYENFMGKDDAVGITEQIYLESFKLKGGNKYD